ncbi:MAG: hypothetical protein JWM74_5219, partial [Myxococcaceae bacterium]|nr:hypothetical protein [Myxococcaceae bacterium]
MALTDGRDPLPQTVNPTPAVSPLRAVVSAHFTASRNRMRRDLGRRGAAVTVLLLLVFGSLAALPFLASLGLGGWFLGKALPKPPAIAILGGLFA